MQVAECTNRVLKSAMVFISTGLICHFHVPKLNGLMEAANKLLPLGERRAESTFSKHRRSLGSTALRSLDIVWL